MLFQRGRVCVVPLLERELGRADVLLPTVIGTNNCLVNDVAGEAFASQRAFFRFAAVASPFLAF